jgi:hypothetical protein
VLLLFQLLLLAVVVAVVVDIMALAVQVVVH